MATLTSPVVLMMVGYFLLTLLIAWWAGRGAGSSYGDTFDLSTVRNREPAGSETSRKNASPTATIDARSRTRLISK